MSASIFDAALRDVLWTAPQGVCRLSPVVTRNEANSLANRAGQIARLFEGGRTLVSVNVHGGDLDAQFRVLFPEGIVGQ